MPRATDSSHSAAPQRPDEALARVVTESMPGGVLIADATGLITLVNRQIEIQFGYTRDELIGQSVDILLPDSLRAAHAAHRPAFMAMPEERALGSGRELLGRRRDGSEFPIEVGLKPLTTEYGPSVLAVIVDVTARRQLEQATRFVVEEQLEFERLVAELSASFINLPADRVDDAIRDALQRIGEALDLDRCTFFRIQAEGVAVAPVFWHRPGLPPPPAPFPITERTPWVHETILAGRTMSFQASRTFPTRSTGRRTVRSAFSPP